MAVKRKAEARPEWEESNRTLVMFTSIMLIMLTFFILLLSKANFDESRYAQVMNSLQESFGEFGGGNKLIGDETGNLVDAIGPEEGEVVVNDFEMARIRALLSPAIMDRDARIIHSKGQKIVSLSAGLLFEPGSSELKPEVEDTLLAFCRIMAPVDVPIDIEGHTDNQPPLVRDVGDNWDISSARAVEVLRFFTERGGLAPERLSAYAYAGTKPRHSNRTPSGRAANNRVDLVLDFEKASAESLKGLGEQNNSFEYKGFDFDLTEPGAQQETRP